MTQMRFTIVLFFNPEVWHSHHHRERGRYWDAFYDGASAVHELEKVPKEDANRKHTISPEIRAWVESAISDIEIAAEHFVKTGDSVAIGRLDKGIRDYANAWHHTVHAEVEAVKLPK